eukprot:jgi/Orpsp1_1/1187353/evm.model.d7180000057086.1
MSNKNSVVPPEIDIIAFDKKFISQQSSIYFLKEGKIITNDEKIEMFNCNDEINKVIVYNNNHLPLFNVQCNALSYPIEKLTIYESNMNEKVIASLKIKRTFMKKKYVIEYFNKTNNKNEILNMECDGSYTSCEIYYGKKKEGGSMICKIVKLKTPSEKDFSIELAPKVDYLFMIAIAICQYKLNLNTTHITS